MKNPATIRFSASGERFSDLKKALCDNLIHLTSRKHQRHVLTVEDLLVPDAYRIIETVQSIEKTFSPQTYVREWSIQSRDISLSFKRRSSK